MRGFEPARRGASLRAGVPSPMWRGLHLLLASILKVPFVDDVVAANQLRNAIELARCEACGADPFERRVVEDRVAAARYDRGRGDAAFRIDANIKRRDAFAVGTNS